MINQQSVYIYIYFFTLKIHIWTNIVQICMLYGFFLYTHFVLLIDMFHTGLRLVYVYNFDHFI